MAGRNKLQGVLQLQKARGLGADKKGCCPMLLGGVLEPEPEPFLPAAFMQISVSAATKCAWAPTGPSWSQVMAFKPHGSV